MDPTASKYRVFGRYDRVPEGWYWALRSTELRAGQVKAVSLLGRELAVFRGMDGRVAALDASCPHLGAPLALGKVEGTHLCCPSHRWKFDGSGALVDAPGVRQLPKLKAKAWPIDERYGLIWVYTGPAPRHPVPFVPELDLVDGEGTYLPAFSVRCHPHVAMAHLVDVQRLDAVHQPVGGLALEAKVVSEHCQAFRSLGAVERLPAFGLLGRLFARGPMGYSLRHWNGCNAAITFGSERSLYHVLVAMRPEAGGGLLGQAVVLTVRRRGILGALSTAGRLLLTQRWVKAMTRGVPPVLEATRFDVAQAQPEDRAVAELVQHVERLRLTPWGMGRLPDELERFERSGVELATWQPLRAPKSQLRN